MLALLNLMVLAAGLGGVSYPQGILDELERAAEGETVDLEDLAMRINDFTPGDQAADLSNITFSEGRMAEGRRFKVAVPDGWTVLKDYEEGGMIETIRPFVLIEGELGDPSSVSMRDRIIYSAMGGDVESEELRAVYAHECIRRALIFQTYYGRSDDSGLSAMRPVLVWSDEVEAVNTRCFVFQQAIRSEGANGLEFGIMPFASDNSDFLRCVLAYSEDTDIEAVRSLVLRIAASVEADKPYELESRTSVRRALGERVSIPDLIVALNNLLLGYSQFSQQIFTASQYKYVVELDGDDFDERACTLAGAQGIADFCNRAIPDFELALDAYDAQARLGASVSDLDSLLNALQQVDKGVFPTSDIFDSDDAAAVDKAGIFDALESLKALRERIRYAKQHPSKPTKLQ